MKFTTGEVTSQVGKEITRSALFFVCDNCEHVEFIVFKIEGQDHVHLQCTNCDTSFCFGGECREMDEGNVETSDAPTD